MGFAASDSEIREGILELGARLEEKTLELDLEIKRSRNLSSGFECLNSRDEYFPTKVSMSVFLLCCMVLK